MLKSECHVGTKVVFGKEKGQKTLAVVKRRNPVKAAVAILEPRGKTDTGTIWRVPYADLEFAKTYVQDKPLVNKSIGIGTKFRAIHNDGNPEWTVMEERGKDIWLCKIQETGDWTGATKPFLTKTIQAALDMDAVFGKIFTESDHFYADLKPGRIVHYSNGHGEYVRCEVVFKDGTNHLKPIALVGNWRTNDLPNYRKNGEVHYPHHVEGIRNARLFSPNASNIWEYRHKNDDPTNMIPISLKLPPMNENQSHEAKLWRIVEEIGAYCNNPKEEPAVTLARVETIIENWKCGG